MSLISNLSNKNLTERDKGVAGGVATYDDTYTKTETDSLVTGLLDDRGNYDASVNTFPATGGSGTAGAIKKGDLWYISVAGTLGGVTVLVGDTIRALVDTPAQTSGNWSIMGVAGSYIPLTQKGVAGGVANYDDVAKTITSVNTNALTTTPYTVLSTDGALRFDCTAGNKVANLPSAIGIAGKQYIFKKIDASANTVTITPNGAETIDGAATEILAVQYGELWIQSTGTVWAIINRAARKGQAGGVANYDDTLRINQTTPQTTVGTFAFPSVSITTPDATTKGLVVKGFTAQSAVGLEVQNSGGTPLMNVDPNGILYAMTAFKTPYLYAITGANNSKLELLSTGISVSRNVADANPALAIDSVLGTSKIIDFKAGGVIKASVNVDGLIRQQNAFAEIYVADNAVAQAIPTGATYTKVTAFDTNGLATNCTADQANDKITITKIGKYRVSFAVSFSDGANVEWKMAAFLNGTEQNQLHFHRKMGAGGDIGSASFNGFINVTTANWDLDIRARHGEVGDQNLVVDYANLNVEYLGE